MKKGIILIAIYLLSSCVTPKQEVVYEGGYVPNVVGKAHIAYQKSNFAINKDGKTILNVRFTQPVVVSVADKPEKWGYFQFPRIGKVGNSIVTYWNLNADAIEAYGNHKFGAAISADGGKQWRKVTYEQPDGILMPNGDEITINTPIPLKVDKVKLPASIGLGGDNYTKLPYHFYKLGDLPPALQGVYLDRKKIGANDWKTEQVTLTDTRAARYTLNNLFPVVWWGDIKTDADKSVIAGIYPGFYIQDNGQTDPKSAIFFYHSTDSGYSWKIQGRILYEPDLKADKFGNERMGFSEPAFEILSDGTYLCVMRTTDGIGVGPMYSSFSKDKGKTWTKPVSMSATGVLPRLLTLENGVTVLSSGRPGVQLRFLFKGAEQFSKGFEMLPYSSVDERVSCGYTGLLATGKDSFIIVYSDFNYITDKNEVRKAIKVREVFVTAP